MAKRWLQPLAESGRLIWHFHIDHNAACLLLQILHNHCFQFLLGVSIGNSMICIWYLAYIPLVIFQNCLKFHLPNCSWNYILQFWNITRGIYAKYHVQIMLLFVYTTTHKRFVIFTCRHFKLNWNTTALSQSNCRNFSCSITVVTISIHNQGKRLWESIK